MIFSVVYLLARCLLGCLMVLARREIPKDADLLVLRHENAGPPCRIVAFGARVDRSVACAQIIADHPLSPLKYLRLELEPPMTAMTEDANGPRRRGEGPYPGAAQCSQAENNDSSS